MTTIRLITQMQRDFAIETIRDTKLGANYEMVIRKEKKTPPQLRTIYMLFTDIAMAAEQYTRDQIKRKMKLLFGVREVTVVGDEVITELKSLADYDVDEAMKFINEVMAWADSYGIEYRHPDDMGRVA